MSTSEHNHPGRRRLTTGLAALCTIACLLAIQPVYATWISASTTTRLPPGTIEVSALTATALFPGATGDVRLKISNANQDPLRVSDLSLQGTNADIAADPSHPECRTTGVSFENQDDVMITIAPNATKEITLHAAVTMSNASDTGCQGATFTIPVTLSVTPAAPKE